MKKLLLFELILFFISIDVTASPVWYEEKQEDTKLYIYGFGKGKSMEEAENSALDYIRKNFVDRYEAGVFLNLDISLLNFPSYELEKRNKVGDEYFILINVKRNELFNQQVMQLDESFKQLNELYNFINNKNDFIKINKFNEILDVVEEIRNKIKIIKLIGKFEDKKYLRFCDKLENEYFNILNKLDVKIVFDNNNLNELYDYVKTNVEKNTAIKINKKSKNTLLISVNKKNKNLVNYNSEILFIIKLFDENNILINYNSFGYNAESNTSFEDAFRKILKIFENDLDKCMINIVSF